MECIFCELPLDRIIDQTDLSKVFRDAFPVTKLHTLVIPKRHVADYFELTKEEQADIQTLIQKHHELIKLEDTSVTGFNIGINIEASAGQTVFHAHVHLIPRRDGDVSNPQGGVRGVIPKKQSY
tara:strand:- start:92 stop:463 length:372 start_codon:yes stop_codon:yes gene_type:complete